VSAQCAGGEADLVDKQGVVVAGVVGSDGAKIVGEQVWDGVAAQGSVDDGQQFDTFVGGNGHRGLLFALGEYLEQQLGTTRVSTGRVAIPMKSTD
jgi:hypothetical protein